MNDFIFYVLIVVLLIAAMSARADVVSLNAEFLQQQGMETMQLLPCNWDKNISKVTVFGYYGERGEFQDVIQPKHLDRYGNSTNLMLSLPANVMRHPNGMTLHHVDIDFQTTRRRCKNGFGFSVGGQQ